MPNTISRYILRRVLMYLFALTGVALLALMLERMLRVINMIANWDGAFGAVWRMLLNLVPHYLGIALPAAFFFGVLLTFNHLNRNSELAVLHASGLGLHRLLRPVIALALLLTVIAAVTFGYLQPYGRYAYRLLAHDVSQVTLNATVQPGRFVHVGDITFMAERVSSDGARLSGIFVHEARKAGGAVVTSAAEGIFQPAPDGRGSILVLRDGMRTELRPAGGTAGTLSFAEYRWPIVMDDDWAVRTRGKDERELTLPELAAAYEHPPRGVERSEIVAEWHARLVHILSMLFLPFLAMPLGLGGGRGGQTYGIVIGLLVLVVYEQLLQFAHALTAMGYISPGPGLWGPFAVFALGSLALFARASLRIIGDPLQPVAERWEALLGLASRLLPRMRRQT